MFTNEVITELEDTMETHEYSRLYRKNAVGVLIPTPLLLTLLMVLLVMAGLAQGSFAWIASGVPIYNVIVITLIPVFGGIVALFVFTPIGTYYETKAKMTSNVSCVFYAAIASSFVSATIVGFPLLFLWSKSLGGMQFRGMCGAVLLPHWYHFVLAGVVGMTWPSKVLWVWARRSTNVSESVDMVLHAR